MRAACTFKRFAFHAVCILSFWQHECTMHLLAVIMLTAFYLLCCVATFTQAATT
jgi:hypothetical protein